MKTTTKKRDAVTPVGKLVIVESPTKARSIQAYLGEGYTVAASVGHVRELGRRRLPHPEFGWEPNYRIIEDHKEIVKELSDLVRRAEEVYLATDPDREGEAISWHIVEATKPRDIPVHRVVFHEITPDAVREAMAHPRALDMDVIYAQRARQILDRVVGFDTSGLLWKKLRSGLSAGRVQTPALGMVVQREREIRAFEPQEYWSLEAELEPSSDGKRGAFTASLRGEDGKDASITTGEQAQQVVDALGDAAWKVLSVQHRETKRKAPAPFTTSTLQQEASRKLRMPPATTMRLAQELFYGVDLGADGVQGLVTYMRTDSTRVAESAQNEARQVIGARFGGDYLPERPPVHVSKAKGAQEAHEAIRPTDPARDPESVRPFLDEQHLALYQLIWQRFIASQMTDAIIDGTTIDVAARPAPVAPGQPDSYLFRATGSVVRFPGWRAAYTLGREPSETDEDATGSLPDVQAGEPLDLLALAPNQHFTQPPPRFSEASLIRTLEEAGLGRPSTYVAILKKLRERPYVTLENRTLSPTAEGERVSDFLQQWMEEFFTVGLTAQMEEQLDSVTSGLTSWDGLLDAFYPAFREQIDRALGDADDERTPPTPTGETCELCGAPLVIRSGKNGTFIGCSGFPTCTFTQAIPDLIGVSCPTCHEGQVARLRSKRGKTFYGCTRYPECEFRSWDRPIEDPCPTCGGYQVVRGKAEEVRCPGCDGAGKVGNTLIA